MGATRSTPPPSGNMVRTCLVTFDIISAYKMWKIIRRPGVQKLGKRCLGAGEQTEDECGIRTQAQNVESRICQLSRLYRFWKSAFVSETRDLTAFAAIFPPSVKCQRNPPHPFPPKSVYRGFGVSGVKTVFQHETCFSQFSSDFLTVKCGLSGIPNFTFRPIRIILTQEATCSSCWQNVDMYLNVRLLCSVIWSRMEADFLIPLKFRTIRNYSEAYTAGETC